MAAVRDIEVLETNEKSRLFRSASTHSDDLINPVDFAEITDFGDCQSFSTSAVLSTCKHKILKPYLKLLAVVGLRSFGLDEPNSSSVIAAFSNLHLIQVIFFTIVAHVLQFVACFRRDRGFACRENDPDRMKNLAFGVIIPSILHFSGYVYALYLFRFKETEKLENLMERTFLLSAHRANGRKTHLLQMLWAFICFSILWVIISLCSVTLLIVIDNENGFRWIHSYEFKILFQVFLVLALVWNDVQQATIITSYCLQVQLLSSSLCFLREKLLEHTIQPLSWIREINECRNVLNYLNYDFSPAVCLFIFLDISWIVSCVIWFQITENSILKISIVIIIGLRLVAALVPFVLAAQLTSAFRKLRHLGHELRIRPFVYQDTPGEDLDTILLYTSTLKMKSKLFAIPISRAYLCTCLTLFAVSVLIAGQAGIF